MSSKQRKASFGYKAQSVIVPTTELLMDSDQPKNPIY